MHIVLHFTSYIILVAPLVVGLAPALIPTKIKEDPIALVAIFSVYVACFKPAPNNDNLFMLFQWAIWSLVCCRLIIYHQWSAKFVEYWLLLSIQQHHSQIQRYILDYPSSHSSTCTFSHWSNISTYCWTLCQRSGCPQHNHLVLWRCCKGGSLRVDKVFIKMLLLWCEWWQTISETSSPPSYTLSPQYLLSLLFLFISPS
jgi:hypothetical protein